MCESKRGFIYRFRNYINKLKTPKFKSRSENKELTKKVKDSKRGQDLIVIKLLEDYGKFICLSGETTDSPRAYKRDSTTGESKMVNKQIQLQNCYSRNALKNRIKKQGQGQLKNAPLSLNNRINVLFFGNFVKKRSVLLKFEFSQNESFQ